MNDENVFEFQDNPNPRRYTAKAKSVGVSVPWRVAVNELLLGILIFILTQHLLHEIWLRRKFLEGPKPLTILRQAGINELTLEHVIIIIRDE